jgi:CBS domain-containing protein
MIPLNEMKRVRPETQLEAAMAEMDRDGVNQLPVMVNGHCQGLLSRGDLVDFMRTRRELGI